MTADLAGTYPLLGTPVPRIGYGMGGATRRAEQGPEARAQAVALLQRAWQAGIRLFDTAHFYGNGLADRLLAEALGSQRDQAFLASKAGALSTPGGPFPMTAGQHPQELRQAVEADLAALGTDHLDLVYLRRMDMTPGLVVGPEQQVPLEDQLAELTALREEGKIRGIGLSHVTREQVETALPAGLVAVQNIYHLLGRQDEALLELCREQGVAWIPYFPLGGGGYAGLPKDTEHPVVRAIAEELGATPNQVGLAWQLAHSPNTVIISGTGDIAHLEENLAAASVALTPEQMERLDGITA